MRSVFHRAPRSRLYLTRRQKLAIYAVLGATWGSGAIWLVLHYFLMHQGPFGPEPHPLEFWCLALHGACAFAALWCGGWLWARHVRPWWNTDRRRSSGIWLLATGALLVISGYLLYYAGNEMLRHVVSIAHWSVGLLLVLPAIAHALRAGRYRRGLQHGGFRMGAQPD